MEVKPFLKWVGGKRKLIPQLEAKFPDYIKSNEFTYVEPFLGGGAIFFYLITKYNIKKAYLNDLNDKLIDCYQNVRDHSEKLIKQLKKLEKDYYSSNDKKLFYLARRDDNYIVSTIMKLDNRIKSLVTAKRRMSTIKSWIRWIDRVINSS